ncbi:hypothetical protein [Tomitella gaofuii]|uniref:hypothetical protein n=1 Tax=Tomitella gaofuii TaxID=2760083 RepID=UPI0015F80B62|nr:hypothetical protein [Tomitella gaofuii]
MTTHDLATLIAEKLEGAATVDAFDVAHVNAIEREHTVAVIVSGGDGQDRKFIVEVSDYAKR